MNKTIVGCLLLALSFSLTACGHLHSVEKADHEVRPADEPEGIHVKIGGEELKVGDKVVVLKSICEKRYRGRSGMRNECSYKPVGEATVVKVIDKDSSIIQPDSGVEVTQMTRFEKKK